MAAGLRVDANTVALWGFDQTRVPSTNYSNAVDSGPFSLPDCLETSDVTWPWIVGGPGGVTLDADGNIIAADNARWSSGSANRNMRDQTSTVGTTAANALIASDFTIEAWIYHTDNSARDCIFTMQNAGNTDGFGIQVEAGGKLRMFWWSNTVLQAALQVAGGTVPLNEWVHVAWVFTINGANRDCEFFINGVSQDTLTAPGADFVAGDVDTAIPRLMSLNNGTQPFHGGVGGLRIQLEALAASELLANYNASTGTFTVDGDTWMAYLLNEEPAVYDYVGAHHLHPSNGPANTFHHFGTIPLLPDAGRGFHSEGGSAQGLWAPGRDEFVSTFQGAAEWTVEFWYCSADHSDNDNKIFMFGQAGSTEAENILCDIALDFTGFGGSGNNAVYVAFENGAGTLDANTTTDGIYTDSDDEYERRYIAIRKRSIGGGQSEVDVWIDGVEVETLGPYDDSTGGDDILNSFAYVFGANGNGGFAALQGMSGFGDHMRISNIARTDEEIEDHWTEVQDLVLGSVAPPDPPDVTRPVVVYISPTPGTPITPKTAIVIQATDPNLVNVSIDVTFPDGSSETVFDGEEFRPLYRGGSSVESITDGFQFTIRRAQGGWPATPTFDAEAVDSAGNRSI